MPDVGLCREVCEQSGWFGELVVLLLLATRTLYVQWKNGQLKTQTVSLQAKVEALSMRPPPSSVTLQLAPHPSLTELVPVASAPPSQAAPDPDHADPVDLDGP